MFPFNLFDRPVRPAARRRTVLSVLTLDDRALPSATLTDSFTPTPPPENSDGRIREAATVLQIIDFAAQEVGDGLFMLTGQVIGENVAGLTVSFSGAPDDVQGRTTTTLSDGTFSIMVRLRPDYSDAGTVSAVASDGVRVSNTADVLLSPTM
jgi:hypothetical protein